MGILAGLALLCILVVVHELGHFLFAKWLGVRVLTFSVGFGPKLLGFKRGDTEYRLSAIPLGGYVKMFGELSTDELTEDEKKHSFLGQALWKKSLIAFAGPLFNLVLPILIFFVILVGHEKVLLPVVGTVFPDEPAALAGMQSGDRIRAVDGQAIDSFNDLVAQISEHSDKPAKLDIVRDNLPLQLTIRPKLDGKVGRIGVMPAFQKPIIVVMHPQSTAAKAGLQSFDEVLTVDGQAVRSFDDVAKLLQTGKSLSLVVKRDGKILTLNLPQATQEQTTFIVEPKLRRFAVTQDDMDKPEFVQRVKDTQKTLSDAESQLNKMRGIAFVDTTLSGIEQGTTASELQLQKGDRIVSVDGKPVNAFMQAEREWQGNPDDWHVIGVQSKGQSYVMAFRLKGKSFGQKTVEAYADPVTEERSVGVVDAFKRAVAQTGELIVLTVQSLWMLVSFQVSASELGGPITIMNVAGQAASQGIAYYLYILSLISVNLGLLNLLPIPILDGGHLMMFAVEAVIRRPLSMRARQIVMQIGFTFVLAMMLLAVFNDLSRIFGQ